MKPMPHPRRRPDPTVAGSAGAAPRLARAAGRAVERLEDRRLFSVALESAVPIPLSAAPAGDPAAPVVADLDADGNADVVVAFPSPSAIDTGFVQVGRGDGSGTFAFAPAVDVGRVTGRPVVGDFDGDGLPDLAFADGFGGQVKVLRNATVVTPGDNGGPATTGPITLAAAQAFPAGVSPEALAVADFDVDGLADLAVGNRSDNTVQVRLGAADPAASLGAVVATLATAADPSTLATGDFNLDDRLDVLAGASGGTGAASGTLQVFAGAGDGTFDPAPTATAGPLGVVAVADINSDQALDVIVGVSDQDRADTLLNNGNGTFALTPGSTGASGTKSVALADLDEDGRVDLVTAVAGQIDVLPGDGAGGFGTALSFDAAGGSGPAVADVNGDARGDVLTVAATPGTATTRTLNVSVGRRVGPDLGIELLTAPPAAVLLGAQARATVRVTNGGTEAVNEPVLIQVVASTDATADELDPLLLQTSPRLKLKPGQAKTVKLKFRYEADAGTYTLTARVDPFGTTGDLNAFNNAAVAANTVSIAQPFVDLSGAIPSLPAASLAAGARTTVSLVVTNAGNTTAAGRLPLALTASTDSTPDASDPVLKTLTPAVRIAPGATKTFRLRFKLPAVVPGTYYLLGNVDPGDSVLESDEANNVAVSPTQVAILE